MARVPLGTEAAAAAATDPPVPRRLAVACSGGRDSTALLHATLRAAAPLGVEVIALHVHHGLMPQADAWQAHLRAQCARWARAGWPLSLVCTRLTERPAAGDSLEAWARLHRYRALGEMARAAGCGVVLLAHHQRDQAETFLLQALRGAGVAGLAAMPAAAARDGIRWLRPWLRRPRSDIEAYVRRHRLSHIDDDSNTDMRLARNRLRLAVWPALVEAFPQAEAVLADAASWAAEAREALDELAALDLPAVTVGTATGPGSALDLARWRGLSPARRANVLRTWLRLTTGRAAPATLVQRLLADLAVTGAPPRGGRQWPSGAGWLREQGGQLVHMPGRKDALAPAARPAGALLSVRRAGRHPLPDWGGVLVVRRVHEGGVPIAWLAHAELRGRVGGETFQAGPGRPARSLKRQFQAAGVAAWQREGPLVYSGGQLVFVPGLGVDARVVGLPGQPLVSLAWEPDSQPD